MKNKQTITEEEFAERIKPALRLFLSVDLENSTSLKHKHGHKHQLDGSLQDGAWLTVVLQFATEFPQLFEAQLQSHARLHALTALPPPPLWKMLGDELLFVQSLQRIGDAHTYLHAFREALAKWNNDVAHSPDRGPLFVKGAAWLAGFPIANAVIDAGDGREDYVGPSIDAGFRIARLATRRRLPVSVDLAWLLLHIRNQCQSSLDLHFDGPATLKGVAEESGYPSLWLEVGTSEYLKAERGLLGYGPQSDPQKMQELCELFITEFGVPPHLPFLEGDPGSCAKPTGYDDALQNHIEFLRQEIYVVDESQSAPAMPPQSAITPEELLYELGESQQGSTE